jgi:hypothetical protein
MFAIFGTARVTAERDGFNDPPVSGEGLAQSCRAVPGEVALFAAASGAMAEQSQSSSLRAAVIDRTTVVADRVRMQLAGEQLVFAEVADRVVRSPPSNLVSGFFRHDRPRLTRHLRH